MRRHPAWNLSLTLVVAAVVTSCAPDGAVPSASPSSAPGALPSGAVIAFSGSEVPAGWTVCDGRATPTGRATPDLRDRFVLGGAQGQPLGETGGAATHGHRASAAAPESGVVGVDEDKDYYAAGSRHTPAVTVLDAENLPPYVRLLSIMKD